nr:hypothetical protein [Moraxella osloensis]
MSRFLVAIQATSPVAATTYLGVKAAGGSNKVAENTAIGTGLITSTVSAGITGKIAVDKQVSPVKYNPVGKLTGHITSIPKKADEATYRSLIRENETASRLVVNGYNVEQNPKVSRTKDPDYKIGGYIYDNMAPETSSVKSIWQTAKGKIDKGQAPNIVITLVDSPVNTQVVIEQFKSNPITGSGNFIIIDKQGKVIDFKRKPR